MESYTVTPIGTLECPQFYRYQQPRQGTFADNEGTVVLEPGHNYEQALKDLDGFSHIWLVYLFHLNQTWRPTVNPPVNPDGKKKGLFATRSPHRPNRIGMSVVKLLSVIPEERRITIGNFDLLDKTPILDIKPYIVSADSHPEASTGWLPTSLDYWQLTYSDHFTEQSLWLFEKSGYDLKEFCEVQLALDPINQQRKRVEHLNDNQWKISFRTWRIHFTLTEISRSITVQEISSGYTSNELKDPVDKYQDKEIHRLFVETF